MFISARFIGTVSVGYEPGMVYNLQIWSEIETRSAIDIMQVETVKGERFGRSETLCSYDSIESFLQNWTDIRTI